MEISKNNKLLLLLSSYFISGVGNWIFLLSIPLIIYDITGSSLYMSMGYAVSFIPYIFIMPFTAVLGDYYDRKKILVLGDIICLLYTSDAADE